MGRTLVYLGVSWSLAFLFSSPQLFSMQFNTHTFKTPQVYAAQHPYLKDTSGICSLILIPLQGIYGSNTHTFKKPRVYKVQHSYLQDTPGICSSILIHSRHLRYLQLNAHTFKTPQVYAVSYLQDTPGICSIILSRHPRYMQHHTFKTLQVYSSTPKFQNCTFLFFFKEDREHDVSINYVD